jgi:hypothetical protein
MFKPVPHVDDFCARFLQLVRFPRRDFTRVGK